MRISSDFVAYTNRFYMINYKELFLNCLPYGIGTKLLRYRHSKRSIIHYDRTLPDLKESTSYFKNIVSVQGFGFSGSGAVTDFLREFSNCLVLGSIDSEGSLTEGNKNVNGEIDFLRHAGGLFEIELYLNDNNLFFKDAVMKRFVKLVNSDMMFHDSRMKLLVNQFYNQLIDFEINTKGHNDYNAHISNALYPDSNIKVMKNIELAQYRSLCRRLLVEMMNTFYEEKYDFLVLDQLCGDFNFDFDKYSMYIPNLKMIVVYRDPRDTYAYALMKDVPWIPHDNVQSFIKWYGISKRELNFDSKRYLIVRFEDLVLNYEETSKQIIHYLCLDIKNHLLPLCSFDPKQSIKNISIWKKMTNYSEDMYMILKTFPEMCYNS